MKLKPNGKEARSKLKQIWIVKHSWPNDSSYTVMPQAYSCEGSAFKAALSFLSAETVSGHKYEVSSLILED